MLHVICLNPAIDKIYRIPDFAAGEDYPGQKPEMRVGGKGVNVARVLSQLGAPVHLYGFLGEGGDIIRKEMEKRCVCSFFDVSGACRTTVNIIDPKSGRETVITEAGPQVGESDVRELLLELSDRVQPGDIVAASGSIIAGAPSDIYAQISRICEEIGAKCALDCNTSALKSSLSGNVRYILGKPNERELCALLQRGRTKDVHALAEMARELMPHMRCCWCRWARRAAFWLPGRKFMRRIYRRLTLFQRSAAGTRRSPGHSLRWKRGWTNGLFCKPP